MTCPDYTLSVFVAFVGGLLCAPLFMALGAWLASKRKDPK